MVSVKARDVPSRVFRLRRLFLLATLLGAGVFLLLTSRTNNYMPYLIKEATQDEYWDPISNYSTIHTKGCHIPFMNPMDDSVKPFVSYPKKMKPCNKTPLLETNKSHIWILKENMHYYNISDEDDFSCCYKSFFRPVHISDITSSTIDSRVEYNSCKFFSDIIKVTDEFVRIICIHPQTVYDTFFLFAVEKKLNNIGKVKSGKKLPYNILVLGIDAVSRLNLHRTMPKTIQQLKQMGAIEYLGYNKVGDNTFPNLMPMLLGRKDTELREICLPNSRSTFDNCPFVWEWFQQAGFATALGEDTAWMGTFNYAKRGFRGTPTDYYLHTFINEAEQHAGHNKDYNAFLCMNEQYFYDILLNYVYDLTTNLKTKLFGFFWETTMSHDYLNYPMVMDHSYVKLFTKWKNSGYLDETILFFVSDHGMRWGKFRTTKQGRLEERLPFLFILTPPSFRINYSLAYKNLKQNSLQLTTPFDVHSTFYDLINLDNIKAETIISRSKTRYSTYRNISLFLPIPDNRTCKSADIDDHWCTCHRSEKMSPDSAEARNAADYTVAHMNSLLEDYPQCAKLALAEVIGVTKMLSGTGVDKVEWPELTIILRTQPGDGVFEATLRVVNASDAVNVTNSASTSWVLAGSISRLNLYGDQSYCVSHYQLKLYCYCTNPHLSNSYGDYSITTEFTPLDP